MLFPPSDFCRIADSRLIEAVRKHVQTISQRYQLIRARLTATRCVEFVDLLLDGIL